MGLFGLFGRSEEGKLRDAAERSAAVRDAALRSAAISGDVAAVRAALDAGANHKWKDEVRARAPACALRRDAHAPRRARGAARLAPRRRRQ
jgi:hypothetical protein